MNLLTKEIITRFEKYPRYSQEAQEKKRILAKFFGGSACTWIVTEAEREGDDWLLYGCANLGYGFEWGYFMWSEIRDLRFPPFGLPLERERFESDGKHFIDNKFKITYAS